VSNKIAFVTLSFEVPLWIHFSRAHLNPTGGLPLRGSTLAFSSRSHHSAPNPKLRTSCQTCACPLMHGICHLNMASDYWRLALDVQNES